MNPNEEPLRFCDVQKISAETEAPHIQILPYLVSVVAPLILEMNFSRLLKVVASLVIAFQHLQMPY